MLYAVRTARIRPNLKGEWSGPAWEQADTLEIANFRPESSEHHPKTHARLLYTKDGLFGIFRVEDRYVRCLGSHYMDPVYKDSCVEFFVQPRRGKGYFNFEFNCGGSLFCFYIVDPTRVSGGWKDATPLPEVDGQRVAVFHSMPEIVEPEISAPTEWVLEFFIPLDLLEKYVGPIGEVQRQEWQANFYKCADGTSHPHWASWSPVAEFDFHLPRCFGTIRFENEGQACPERK
jgi:hypothetical protein